MVWRSVFVLAVLMFAVALDDARAQQGGTGTGAAAVTYAAQGWSDADRNTFYTTSQGSRMMPYVWFKALRRLDVDQPFAADKLQRYGYLPNDPSPVSNPEGLPVGFQLIGRMGREADLLRTARTIESRRPLHLRRPPMLG